jgi:hypothetical protein
MVTKWLMVISATPPQAEGLMDSVLQVFPGRVPRAVLHQAFSLDFPEWNSQQMMLISHNSNTSI